MQKKNSSWIYSLIVIGFVSILTISFKYRYDDNKNVATIPKTYYISATGNDNNTGTSPARAWKTVEPVNAIGSFNAGTQILFKGGDSFTGPLNISMTGIAGSICILGSYGTGKATLKDLAPYKDPICKLSNSEFITVRNLRFIGTPGTNYPGLSFVPVNKGAGLLIISTRTSGIRFSSISVDSCVFMNTLQGLNITSNKFPDLDGFDGIRITNSLFDNVYQFGCYVIGYGILNGGPVNQHLNVYVGNNQFRNINGDPNFPSEAQALSVSGATGITIEKNIFTSIAGFGGYYGGTPNGGSTAFGVSNCRNFKIQHNEIYGTKCARQWDGCAIDADQDAKNGEICYNLTYNNDGPSIQFGSFKDKITSNIAIHHNISYNDVRGCKPGSVQGAIRMWGHNDTIQIFNNSIYIDKSGTIGTPSCINFEVGDNNNITVLNNIFKTTQGIPMIRPNGTLGGEYNPNHISNSCKFIGNCYDSSGGTLIISTDNTLGSYTNITTLAAWQALGQEKIGNALYGVISDAGFSSLETFNPPAGGFLPLQEINKISNFDLTSGSACHRQTLNPWPYVTLQSPLTVQTADYRGNTTATINIGAVN